MLCDAWSLQLFAMCCTRAYQELTWFVIPWTLYVESTCHMLPRGLQAMCCTGICIH